MPNEGSPLTQLQINASINILSFAGSSPGGKDWHKGLFEPWALDFGYSDGRPLYANVMPGDYHIYWLNDGHQQPIILKPRETPATYGVSPA